MKRPNFQQSTFTSLTATGSTWRMQSDRGYRQKSLVLEAALQEYRRRRQQGESVSPDEFCGQFPDYRKSLRRLIDVEDTLGDLGDIDDPFPVPGGSFLGFEILDQLGVGAIARVYLATEPELGGRTVVIKVSADGTDEAATLGKLQHPNIVQVYSVKRDEMSEMTAVCMPYQGSATLTDVLDLALCGGGLPDSARFILDVATRLADVTALRDDDSATQINDPLLERATYVDGIVHLGAQLCDALEYAHAAGVLHRDLKPSNVLLTPHGRPMLLDFNLSFDAANDSMPRGGTLPYMAPEEIRAGIRRQPPDATNATTLDPRGDIFSLGVILYELLTLKLPYGGPPDHIGPESASLWQLNALEKPPPPIRDLNPEVSPAIAAVVERCLAADPADRFSTVNEVAAALRLHFTPRARAGRWFQRHRRFCQLSSVIVILLMFAAAAFAVTRPSYAERQAAYSAEALQRGDLDGAILAASKAISEDSSFGRAYFLRAIARWAGNEHAAALDDFAMAAKLSPSVEVFDHWGSALSDLGKYAEARDRFRDAAKLAPNDANLQLKVAAAGTRLQKLDTDVLSDIELAIHLDPASAEAFFLRCYYWGKQHDALRATGDGERATELDPENLQLRVAIADVLATIHRNSEQIEAEVRRHLDQAVTLGLARSTLVERQCFRLYRKKVWSTELSARATGNNRVSDDAYQTLILVPGASSKRPT